MGKYMKKSKITGDMEEATEATSFGVRTRAAKTLALKRLNSSASDSSCYLQLRSRRLEKPPSLVEPKQLRINHKSGIEESGSKADSVNEAGSVSVAQSCNSPEFQTRQSTRESTPCNFVEDQEVIVIPGSSTRSMRTAARDYTRDLESMVPISNELEEFFAYAEQQQQRLFLEKYNFDFVNDVPLTGRYEWVQVSP